MNEMPNDVNLEPKKSKNKLLIFGGLGCGLLLLLCVGGIGGMAYFAFDIMEKSQNAVEAELMTSNALEELLGSPIEVGTGVPQQQQPGTPVLILSGKVSGPKGEGTYTGKFAQKSMFDFPLESLTVEVDGEEIDVTEEELDLGIELGE